MAPLTQNGEKAFSTGRVKAIGCVSYSQGELSEL